ncbi:hypothetical protein HanPSC8_Chr09g0394771 [Helianthus annuus]|nr:hypothetical protein HanPSC8_Chr09g0394771 [Helianthus annuus]
MILGDSNGGREVATPPESVLVSSEMCNFLPPELILASLKAMIYPLIYIHESPNLSFPLLELFPCRKPKFSSFRPAISPLKSPYLFRSLSNNLPRLLGLSSIRSGTSCR